jgi:hypothetical protein
MNKETLPCGCVLAKTNTHAFQNTVMCAMAQRLYAAWESAGRKYERLDSKGNEIALKRAFNMYFDHFKQEASV